ncbi:MAG: tRNA pseudouridine(55) synthase TruB, partial [Oscillospiraceae bacterium]
MHNGILVVDKPSDWTSFDVIAKMRGVLKTKKIGHSGTLDPMATGVLPLFIGPAARAVDMQTNHQKAYTAHILLGKKTDTADITGEVLETCDKIVSEDEFKNILPSLCGEQLQMPPMYSAIKINGQALYKLARKGIEIKREPRKIEIFAIDFVGKVAENEYEINIKCSKGTYIRVLAEDIGTALGTLATMSALRRT